MCALGSEADICEAGWVGGVHVSTLGSGEDYCEADWVGGVQVCPLGSGKDICEVIGWAGCICVLWGLEETTVRLLVGRGACVSPGHWTKEF